MGMKKQSALMMMTMLAMANDGFIQDVFEEENKRNKPLKKIIPNGCEEFFYGANSVIARNKKNADKKAKKRGFFI